MTFQALQLPINLAYARGAYTVTAELGQQRRVVQLLLDTGSSAFAVWAEACDPNADSSIRASTLAQHMAYGSGSWSGPVLQAPVSIGVGAHSRKISDARFAYIASGSNPFGNADGILGLAYSGLDRAHDCASLLEHLGHEPAATWPWPFDLSTDAASRAFESLLRQQPSVTVEPVFSALVEEGVIANRFALTVPRALVHVLDDQDSLSHRAADPFNQGLLVVGGGAECQSLYQGPLQDIRVLHDRYYNVRLIGLRVGDGDLIPAPPLQPQHQQQYVSNAIVDSGCSFVVLEHTMHAALLQALAAHRPHLPELVTQSQQGLADERGIDNQHIVPHDWPDLHWHLEAPDGSETMLRLSASHYWQRNALRAGQSVCLILPQLPDWPAQSLLGLPLLSGRYCIFDRNVGTAGVVRLALTRD